MGWGAGMSIRIRVLSWLLRGVGIALALLWFVPRESVARVAFQAAPAIPVPNLVGYWCVDGPTADAGTAAKDNSGNGNNGTYTSGLTTMATAPSVPAGNLRSYALTQASRQYISVPDSASLSITGSLTIAAWVKSSDTPLQQGIVEKWDDPNVTGGYMFRLDANENLDFSICSAAGANGVSTAPRPIPLNVWTHVAGVYANSGASGTITNYVNATPDATVGTGIAPPTDGTTALQIGSDHGSNAFNGNLDEVRIYNRALSTPEIAILKNGQPAPTGLVATGGLNQIQLTWTGAANNPTYSVLRGTSSGVYDTVFNGVAGVTYTDTTVTGGTPYSYAVVAVTVMASATSNEYSAIATAGPPPPPPAPRTEKTGNQGKQMCGWSTADVGGLPSGLLIALLVGAVVLGRPRR
jgi:hypothetical protein